MPNYTSDGRSPLKGGAPVILTGSVKAQPGGSGTDAGGTENLGAETKVLSGGQNTTPSGSDHRPEGVQSFTDTVK